MKKISLVLEGGGMRGAYTAGCLSWLIDEGIEFDAAYGISTGAVHLSSYLLKNKDYLLKASTEYIAAKDVIGVKAFFKEARAVAYDYLFDHYIDDVMKMDFDKLRATPVDAKIGLYDLAVDKTVYIPIKEITKDKLKAACSLPVISKIVHTEGHSYLDGGITDMIPIFPSVNDGNDAHLIITTKPYDYVRKPSTKFVCNVMKMLYPKNLQISKDYAIRHENYYKQINLIQDLEKQGKAFYRYPTEKVEVSRLRGDKEDLLKLYELGRKDMEASKEDIYKVLGK